MIRSRVQESLKQAMLDRDRAKVSTLRTVISAIDNASAVPASVDGLAIEASPIGAGASDVERRSLTESEIAEILESEALERDQAAAVYQTAGETDRAVMLLDEATLIRSFLG